MSLAAPISLRGDIGVFSLGPVDLGQAIDQLAVVIIIRDVTLELVRILAISPRDDKLFFSLYFFIKE
jgi:hypothetical protein